MKNILNVTIFALLLSVGSSMTKNYMMLQEISSMQHYLDFSADRLQSENDLIEKYNYNKCRLMKATIFDYQTKTNLFNSEGKLFKKIDDKLSGNTRFFLEKERSIAMRKNSFLISNPFNNRIVQPKIDFTDQLHIGYRETLMDNCKYEIFLNGEAQEENEPGFYECDKAPKILIDINKIFINPKTQDIDSLCISRFIGRA